MPWSWSCSIYLSFRWLFALYWPTLGALAVAVSDLCVRHDFPHFFSWTSSNRFETLCKYRRLSAILVLFSLASFHIAQLNVLPSGVFRLIENQWRTRNGLIFHMHTCMCRWPMSRALRFARRELSFCWAWARMGEHRHRRDNCREMTIPPRNKSTAIRSWFTYFSFLFLPIRASRRKV